MSNQKDYSIGWICATSTEYVATQVFLDEEHEGPESVSLRQQRLYIGQDRETQGCHRCLARRGTRHILCNKHRKGHAPQLSSVRTGPMAGIGGGAPSSKHDFCLDDVVVSTPRDGKGGVFQYGIGKKIRDQSFRLTGFLNQPPTGPADEWTQGPIREERASTLRGHQAHRREQSQAVPEPRATGPNK